MTRFTNQVAVVTGGADGIGKAIARRLASEGAAVVIFDRDRAMAERTQAEFGGQGLRARLAIGDVSVEEDVRTGFRGVAEQEGRLDVMVNCAGVVGPTSTKVDAYPAAEFDRVCAVNLGGSFLTAKYALEVMARRNYGKVLLIASMAGKEGNPGMCGYSASKAGVIGLVKALGKEYAETGMLVNGLAPAVIRTAMVDASDPAQVKYMMDRIPMKRCGTVEEVAALAAWIVSPECTFNTGFVFDLSGGRATY